MAAEGIDDIAKAIRELELKRGTTPTDITQVFRWATGLADRYADAAELAGPMVLVLDTCLLEDLRREHQGCEVQRIRPLRAAAFRLFCAFVACWSDRHTTLGLSPVVIYEQLRGQSSDKGALKRRLRETEELLQATRLLTRRIGFAGINDLAEAFKAVADDEARLVSVLRQIDNRKWDYDLSSPLGVRIPCSIAEDVVADSFPPRYFDAWYVRYALVSRVEQRIIRDSPNPRARSLSSGDLARALTKLMRVTKAGWVEQVCLRSSVLCGEFP